MSAEATPGLLDAVLAVQGEAPTLPKDKTNPHYKSRYTPLDTIVEKIGPILHKHGLVWLTLPGRDERGEPALHYRLAYAKTGEAIDGTMPLLLSKGTPQEMGSAITYARRYALCAVLNLVADDDDDGSAAQRSAAKPSTYGSTGASDAQRKKIFALTRKHGVTRDELAAIVSEWGVELQEGWLDKLTPGRDGTASKLIERLQTPPSDVPANADDFKHPDPPVDGEDVPFQEELGT